ncbi:hypothetical protein C8R44DRAFT_753778 [Mycena epipterygia]|nr:hypothetical protein C8R44DRAFT_753778 [Mycena epipterygia]
MPRSGSLGSIPSVRMTRFIVAFFLLLISHIQLEEEGMNSDVVYHRVWRTPARVIKTMVDYVRREGWVRLPTSEFWDLPDFFYNWSWLPFMSGRKYKNSTMLQPAGVDTPVDEAGTLDLLDTACLRRGIVQASHDPGIGGGFLG